MNSNRKAQSVPDAPRVTNTTPPTPPQTASIAGNPTIIPSVTAGAPPPKNADVTSAAATDFHTTSDGFLIFSTPPIKSLWRNRQTLWGGCTDANPKLLLNDT